MFKRINLEKLLGVARSKVLVVLNMAGGSGSSVSKTPQKMKRALKPQALPRMMMLHIRFAIYFAIHANILYIHMYEVACYTAVL